MTLPFRSSYIYKHHSYLSFNQTNFSPNENELKVILIYYHSLKKFTERIRSYFGGSGAIVTDLEQKHPKKEQIVEVLGGAKVFFSLFLSNL